MNSIEVTILHRGKRFTSFLDEKGFTREKEYIKPMRDRPTKSEQSSIDYIVKHYGIKEDDLLSRQNEKHNQIPRQHLCFLLRKKGRTLKRIGNIIGRHHASIIYLLRNYDNYKDSEEISRTGN